MPADAPLISIENVTKRFPGVVALDGVSFDVRAGEFHAVVGENGAGKSTLMKILSGVIPDYEGTLRINGAGGPFCQHAQGRGRRHLHHSPGIESGRRLVGRGQRLFGTRTPHGLGPVGRPGHAAGGRDAVCRAGVQYPPRPAGAPAPRRRPATGRDRQGPVAGRVDLDHGRADECAHGVGSRAAVPHHRAAAWPAA